MFGTKPEIASWAGWHPSVDGPADRRANSVTVKVGGRLGDRGNNHLGSGRGREKGQKLLGNPFADKSYLKNDGSFLLLKSVYSRPVSYLWFREVWFPTRQSINFLAQLTFTSKRWEKDRNSSLHIWDSPHPQKNGQKQNIPDRGKSIFFTKRVNHTIETGSLTIAITTSRVIYLDCTGQKKERDKSPCKWLNDSL